MDDQTTGRRPDDDIELTQITRPGGARDGTIGPDASGGKTGGCASGGTIGGAPDDETQVMSGAGDDATRVMPGSQTGATRVMPGSETAATRVMRGADDVSPPPDQPTLVMTRGGAGGGSRWWLWLVVLLLIAAAALAAWFFFGRPGEPLPVRLGDAFIGNWTPRNGAGGGLVIKPATGDAAGDRLRITQYDAELQEVGTRDGDLMDEELRVTLKASALRLTEVTGGVRGTLTHDAADDTLTLRLESGDFSLQPIVFERVDVLPAASIDPTPSFSPSPSPSPSPSESSTPSPESSVPADANQVAISAFNQVQAGILAWAADNNGLYPSPEDVVAGSGLSQYVDPWPMNPFNGEPMLPGTAPGSYVYEQLSGGQAYQLTGYLPDGLTYVLP